jgi:1-deoxy-D-xylulose-5-phosphate reductoisomerase
VSDPVRLVLLGSTGSIGRQTLDVVAHLPDEIAVVALAAHSNDALLVEQAAAFDVGTVALADADAAQRARTALPSIDVRAGADGVDALAALTEADVVINALVGAAGLRATMAALSSGKILGLANKESLVVGGALVTSLVGPDQLIPVDSEHSAIFQCLAGERRADVARLWLTASGGPFRGMTREQLGGVTPEQALSHPTWAMGPKISIDSATLMNKGLEVIEAHHLFRTDYDDIDVVVHPQSCIHSMVEFDDGSVKAHLGATDMRIPIQYALSYPRRWPSPVEPVDFTTLASLDFEPPDTETFGCLQLAFDAGAEGGTMPAVLNAANEVAVAAFLEGGCGFLDIEGTVARVMEDHDPLHIDSVEQLEMVDLQARKSARDVLES